MRLLYLTCKVLSSNAHDNLKYASYGKHAVFMKVVKRSVRIYLVAEMQSTGTGRKSSPIPLDGMKEHDRGAQTTGAGVAC